jgi:hypothetical protein
MNQQQHSWTSVLAFTFAASALGLLACKDSPKKPEKKPAPVAAQPVAPTKPAPRLTPQAAEGTNEAVQQAGLKAKQTARDAQQNVLGQKAATPPAPAAAASGTPSEVLAKNAFNDVYKVLMSPRCLNCHPVGDRPFQGEDSHVHAQNVQRGRDGEGLFGMKCATCHGTQNAEGPHMPPGAPNWHLPKPEMPLVFEGLSAAQLCRNLKDPAKNGGKTPEQIVEHMSHDPLVLWGWNPGVGRELPPLDHATFAAAAQTWLANGCACPD